MIFKPFLEIKDEYLVLLLEEAHRLDYTQSGKIQALNIYEQI